MAGNLRRPAGRRVGAAWAAGARPRRASRWRPSRRRPPSGAPGPRRRAEPVARPAATAGDPRRQSPARRAGCSTRPRARHLLRRPGFRCRPAGCCSERGRAARGRRGQLPGPVAVKGLGAAHKTEQHAVRLGLRRCGCRCGAAAAEPAGPVPGGARRADGARRGRRAAGRRRSRPGVRPGAHRRRRRRPRPSCCATSPTWCCPADPAEIRAALLDLRCAAAAHRAPRRAPRPTSTRWSLSVHRVAGSPLRRPGLISLEINPLIVTTAGAAWACDALVVLRPRREVEHWHRRACAPAGSAPSLEVTLDRPPANAIDLATSRAMGRIFAAFRDDPRLRVAVLRTGGRAVLQRRLGPQGGRRGRSGGRRLRRRRLRRAPAAAGAEQAGARHRRRDGRGRRLRAGPVRRPDLRRRHRVVRPARDQRRHPGRRGDAAAARPDPAPHRHGAAAHRPLDGRRGGAPLGAGQRGAPGRPARRPGARGGRAAGRGAAAGLRGDQGGAAGEPAAELRRGHAPDRGPRVPGRGHAVRLGGPSEGARAFAEKRRPGVEGGERDTGTIHGHGHGHGCAADHHRGEYTERQRADLDLVLAFNHRLAQAVEDVRRHHRHRRRARPGPAALHVGGRGRRADPGPAGPGRAPCWTPRRSWPGRPAARSGWSSAAATRPAPASPRTATAPLVGWLEWQDGRGDRLRGRADHGGTERRVTTVVEGPEDLFRPTAAITADGTPWLLFGRSVAGPGRGVGGRLRRTRLERPGAGQRHRRRPSFNQEVLRPPRRQPARVLAGPGRADRFGVFARRWHAGVVGGPRRG